MWVRMGTQVKRVQLILPVAFIIGDGKSNDHLCCRYGGHRTKRACRACTVPFSMLDVPGYQCQWLPFQTVDDAVCKAMDENSPPSVKKTATNNIHNLSTHLCYNAFRDVCFGGDSLGIMGATPTDLMHAFLEGVLMYIIRVFAAQLTKAQKANVDHLVGEMVLPSSKNTCRRKFPRVSFANGITNLTLLTADEWGGVAFTLLLLANTPRGQQALHIDFTGDAKMDEIDNQSEASRKSDSDSDNNTHMNPTEKDSMSSHSRDSESDESIELATDRHINAIDFIQLVEMLLSFHSWYERGSPYQWTEHSYNELLGSIQSMMNAILKIVPRKKGFGWKVQKFHELLHVPFNVMRFGSPQNFDASSGERSLKHWAKHPAKTSHKAGAKAFTIQVANRVHERSCMEKCARAMQFSRSIHGIRHLEEEQLDAREHETDQLDEPTGHSNKIQSELVGNPKFSIRFPSPTSRKYTYQWHGKQQQQNLVTLHPSIKQWFVKKHVKHKYSQVYGYTEYRRDGILFRCHPNYKSQGPWYDWAVMQFEDEASNSSETNTLGNSSGYWVQIMCQLSSCAL